LAFFAEPGVFLNKPLADASAAGRGSGRKRGKHMLDYQVEAQIADAYLSAPALAPRYGVSGPRRRVLVNGLDGEGAGGPVTPLSLLDLRVQWILDSRVLFWGALPLIEIALERPRKGTVGCFIPGRGGDGHRVVIDPRILSGRVRDLRGGSGDPLGCQLWALDVLLHEAAHCHLFNLDEERFRAVHNHGEDFLAECRRLNGHLGSLRRRDVLTLENCVYWPQVCRRRSYYNCAGCSYKDLCME
jgi:hypothetical protein